MVSHNPNLDPYVARAIIDHITKHEAPITYVQLADIVGQLRGDPITHRSFGPCLDRMHFTCNDLELPTISFMVVRNDGSLNPIVTEFYRHIHPETVDVDEIELIREVQQACLDCKNWQKLLDYYSTTDSEVTH